jgi:hypothetical protein
MSDASLSGAHRALSGQRRDDEWDRCAPPNCTFALTLPGAAAIPLQDGLSSALNRPPRSPGRSSYGGDPLPLVRNHRLPVAAVRRHTGHRLHGNRPSHCTVSNDEPRQDTLEEHAMTAGIHESTPTATLPEVDLPFPLRYNPHADTTRPRTRDWAIATGMLPTAAAQAWWDEVNFTAITAWSFPDASPDRFLLCDKWISLSMMFDDQFDGTSLGYRLPEAARVLDHMTAAIEHQPSSAVASLYPFSRAAADLLTSLAEVMSPVWLRRHRHNLVRWWFGIVQTTAHRALATSVMPFERRLAVRRLNVGMDAVIDLLEVACGWELPPSLDALEQVRRIREIVGDIMLFQNDVCSVDKDRADGSDDNVLFAWEAEGYSSSEAISLALDRITQLADELAVLIPQLPPLAAALGLAPSAQQHVQEWTTACGLFLTGSGRCQAIGARYVEIITAIAHDHQLDRLLPAGA